MAKSLVPLGAQFMSTGCFCNDFREGQATIQERAREREREKEKETERKKGTSQASAGAGRQSDEPHHELCLRPMSAEPSGSQDTLLHPF